MSKNVTLDPENWDEFKKLGHKMLEDALTHLQNIRELPTEVNPEGIKKLTTPLTEDGEGAEQVYNILQENFIPYDISITRPQSWGFVNGTGSPYGVLVDMLVSSKNSGMGLFGDVPIWLQSLSWIKELLEIPQDYGGTYVSGGSEANFTGIAVARNSKAAINMKTKGVQNVQNKMVLYGSEEIHHCLERSVELLGLGNEAIRWIPVDENYSIKIDELEKKIKEDRKNGFHPFCVIGCAGTVNTGAFDDLNGLADLCQKEDMWFHVDGAFGAWIKLSETHKQLADGLERADSIAVDLHKWMNMPYTVGVTLVKDKLAQFSTFVYGHDAMYLDSAVSDQQLDMLTLMSSLGLSRPNLGLRTYMLLRANGKKKYRNLIQQNIDDIAYLGEKLEKDEQFELTAPVISNIVCFRYVPKKLSEEKMEELNRNILAELWKTRWGIISDTTIKGKYMLRACNVNHRTKREDFDYLITEIKNIGAELV